MSGEYYVHKEYFCTFEGKLEKCNGGSLEAGSHHKVIISTINSANKINASVRSVVFVRFLN